MRAVGKSFYCHFKSQKLKTKCKKLDVNIEEKKRRVSYLKTKESCVKQLPLHKDPVQIVHLTVYDTKPVCKF